MSSSEAKAATASCQPLQPEGSTAVAPRRIRRRPRRTLAAAAAVTVSWAHGLYETVLETSRLPHQVYSFEILKTVHKILALHCTHVALQLPEGLVRYATALADVILTLCRSAIVTRESNDSNESASSSNVPQLQHVCVLADVTYGACCVDDLTAAALGCQLLVHYGHSCLVPLQHSVIPVLYVFVELTMQRPQHVTECVVATLHATSALRATNAANDTVATIPKTHIYLLGTIQFRHALTTIRDQLLAATHDAWTVSIPQCHPLSPGEVLGCTSPKLTEHLQGGGGGGGGGDTTTRAIVCFVADGRFHLEAIMISHRHSIDAFYRYDPYAQVLTHETYDHVSMSRLRSAAIESARSAHTFGILLGTLGRQGNPAIVQRIQEVLRRAGKRYYVLLVSEITTVKLQLLSSSTDAWVQVACPRLSVDWGHVLGGTTHKTSHVHAPVLSPYELYCCFDPDTQATSWSNQEYPMDYYSTAGGPWSNYYTTNQHRQWHPLPAGH